MMNINRTIRVLTFIGFFNFSGLNNGWTTFIVSSGKIQSGDFAPVAIVKCAQTLNPANWKKAVLNPLRHKFFPKSAQVLENASQRAIQKILIKSTLFQVWFKDAYIKAVNSQEIDHSNKNSVVAESKKGLSGHGQEMDQNRQSHLAQNTQTYQTQSNPEYLKKYHDESWLRDRFHLIQNNQHHSSFHSTPHVIEMMGILQTGQITSEALKRAKKWIKTPRTYLTARLTFISEPDEDHSSYNTNEKKNTSRQDLKAGFSFYKGKKANWQVTV